VRDVCAEALLVGCCAAPLGAALGLGLGVYLERVGIDLSAFGSLVFAGVAFDPIWRAALTPAMILKPMIAMCLAVVVAGLYPAIRAARLRPLRALHEP
jgi:ABC-type antimicrobial peptide transport system permease subunit